MASRSSRTFRVRIAASTAVAVALGCEAIAGYNDVEPWPPEAGNSASGGERSLPEGSAGGSGGRDASGGSNSGGTLPEASSSGGAGGTPAMPDGSIRDSGAGGAMSDVSVGPCPILTGNDACAEVPRFTAGEQVVDGVGEEFCDVPAMVFDVATCPTVYTFGAEPSALPERVFLRIAWSVDAFHLHVRVVDPNVIVNPLASDLWSGDAVEIFVAGTSGSGLSGSYDGTNDGGAIQIVLAPPAGGFPTRGQAFFNPGNGVHTNAPISNSIYAGRLIDEGYELELRFPWVAFADPAIVGGKIAFNIAIGAQVDADAGGRQLQCILSDKFVDGALACGYPRGTPAQPWCDDRTWCQPELQP